MTGFDRNHRLLAYENSPNTFILLGQLYALGVPNSHGIAFDLSVKNNDIHIRSLIETGQRNRDWYFNVHEFKRGLNDDCERKFAILARPL